MHRRGLEFQFLKKKGNVWLWPKPHCWFWWPASSLGVRRFTTCETFAVYGAQAGSTLQRCKFQRYYTKEVCLPELCVQVLCPVTLVRRKVNSTLVCQNKPCCDLVKRALTQNKPCWLYMCEITLFLPFLIDTVPHIVRYCRERICRVWANRPRVQKLTNPVVT